MSGPQEFRKRPVVIKAMPVPLPDLAENDLMLAWGHLAGWLEIGLCNFHVTADDGAGHGVEITTLEGVMLANPGDWIIRGVNGEFYPCKPDIFAKTYEPENGDSVWCEACPTLIDADVANLDVEGTVLCDDCWAELVAS